MISFLLFSVVAVGIHADTLPGFCSFEGTTCDYSTDPAFLSWTFSPNGNFITVAASPQSELEKALLLGPDVDQQDWGCFRLVYQLTGTASLLVQKRLEGESFDHVLWSAHSPSDRWLVASIDVQNSSEPYKIVIEGRPGTTEGSSASIFEVKVSNKYCIECDFEDSDLCGYTNQWNSNVNWYVARGTSNDITHTDGAGLSDVYHFCIYGKLGCPPLVLFYWSPAQFDNYMYADSVHAKNLQEVAKLVSPMTTVPMSGCFSFQYQHDHAEGHLFSVYSRDRAGQYQELWRADQEDWRTKSQVWIPVQVALRAPYPLEVVFEVSFNSPKGGRVALDDISFSPEFCSAGTEPTFNPSVANCDFELGFCRYTQKTFDSDMWKRVSVNPNTYSQGDHTTGSGFFLLASPRFTLQSGYVRRLFGPPLPGSQKFCLKFFYSLRGFSKIDQALTVYLYDTTGTQQEKIWTQSEKTRDVWMQTQLTIQSQKPSRVVFVSVCKSFWNCVSVALDDISVSLGDCELQAGPGLSVPCHCDFESGLCGYIQDKEGDVADWVRARGPTPTSYTGPKADHTTGAGHYLHIEASLMLPGHSARLLSTPLRGSRGPQCLLFFYHMYGSGTGQLKVLLLSELEDRERLLWVRHGEQGISWFRASVSYQYDHEHQIVFEAIRGQSIRSDIAIDDIVFQKGACKDADKQNSHFGLTGDHNVIE